MFDGYQVLRFENNYKSKDLYLIGNEMNNRVGTGNYDKERTKFNIKYKELDPILNPITGCGNIYIDSGVFGIYDESNNFY